MPRQALGLIAEAEEVLLIGGNGDGADGELFLAEFKGGLGSEGGVIAFVEWQGDGAIGVFADLVTSGGEAVDGDVRAWDVGNNPAGFAGEALDVNKLSLAGLAFGGNKKGTLATELVKGELRPHLRAGGEHADDVVFPAPALE